MRPDDESVRAFGDGIDGDRGLSLRGAHRNAALLECLQVRPARD